jgi:membrane dipeptidase
MIPGVPATMEKELGKDNSIDTKVKTAVEQGASGIIFMNVDASQRRAPRIKKETCPEGFVVLFANRTFCDDVFYLSNSSWRYLVSKTLRERRPRSATLEVSVKMEAHYIEEDREAPNVIGLIPGSDPELKHEYILIGGHLDHLGVGIDGFVYNGADDDASGVAVVLEVARVLKANRVNAARSIVFCAWAGEELGLVGSRYYTNNPVYPLEKTAIYLNMDMVGSGDTDLYVGGMWENESFFNILRDHLDKKYKDKLRYRLAYRGSDHSSFLSKGVTWISLRSGGLLNRALDDEHPEYHYAGDVASTIEPEILQLAAEYHLDIVNYLATTREKLLEPKHHISFVHREATLVDLHCDTIGRYLGENGEDLSQDLDRGHLDIPKLKRGAVDMQVFACYVAPPGNEKEKYTAAKKAFTQIDGIHRLVGENPEDLSLVRSYQDLRGLRGTGKIGVLIGIEGGYAIENDLSLLRSFYRSGVRLMTLTHWTRTDWADASGDEVAQFGGLTPFGEQVVKEMNKLGMIIDVSHAHDDTFWDVLKVTEHPIVASHSCARALSEHHRNMSDEMLKALAENGGVIGINFAPGFLNSEVDDKMNEVAIELAKKHGLPADRDAIMRADPEKRQRFLAEYQEKARQMQAMLPTIDVKTVVDHMDHIVKVTGSAKHVALGSDFDGIGATPQGLENVGLMANITEELFHRGYEESDIKSILGGNFLRVFQKVCGAGSSARR